MTFYYRDVRDAMDEWRNMLMRGRRRILKVDKDPVARARLDDEIPSPKQLTIRPSPADRRCALEPVPAYCHPTSVLSHPEDVSRFSFITTFPPEIRNLIYQFALEYPHCHALFDAYYRQLESFESEGRAHGFEHTSNFRVKLHTPTILLLCKQVTREALPVLRLRPFVIDRAPPWLMGHRLPLPLTNFISKATLQSMAFVEIKMCLGDGLNVRSGKVWSKLLRPVLEAWSERNVLVRLRIMFKIYNLNHTGVWYYELKDYERICAEIDRVAFKHFLRTKIVEYEHWVVDREFAYRCGFRNPLIRRYPDPNIWQGYSLMEWA
ncbi:hypothetical protein F5Y15DRAFT_75592 [Xylariaceae sp. FL0016]|nr:hypothetical protein F5Y15DRAFT_75592 [Xylariaceae sp. FL0016]